MNYTEVLNALNNASLFDLYRLSAAINNQLVDPTRLAAVKRALVVGQTLRYFDSSRNRLVDATLLRIDRTRASVRNLDDGKPWHIPFFMIDLEGSDVQIAATSQRGLDRNSLKVGDRVAYRSRAGHECYGEVVKLNPKTAGVLVGNQHWRVPYRLLSLVIDGDLGDPEPELLPAHRPALSGS
jgi:hypothetical protein